MNSDAIVLNHLLDLSKRAYERNYTTYSEFLNMNEISLLSTVKTDTPFKLFGGYDMSERCVAGFGESVSESEFPICCIKAEPLLMKFSDKLTHRDFLGSLMQLGINRNTLGDIIVRDNSAYIFCLKSICEYIIDNLSRVKHTSVKCSLAESIPNEVTNSFETKEIIISSPRADSVISSVYKLSRSQAKALFESDRVFINSKECKKEGTPLKDGDRVSVRTFGKFIFESVIRKTKKDRAVAVVRIYK